MHNRGFFSAKLKKRVNQETLVGTGGDSDDDMGTPTPEDEVSNFSANENTKHFFVC